LLSKECCAIFIVAHGKTLCREALNKRKKMNTEPEKESAEKKPEDFEVKVVPEGTFGGHIDKPELVEKGKVIPEDTGDQGGGQN
jgi:hypothetical protein